MCSVSPDVAWAPRPCAISLRLAPRMHGRGARATVIVALLLALGLAARAGDVPPTTAPTAAPVIHIAADPNNLPFSNDKLEGFENKIAQLVADDLGAKIEYIWWPQRRGFFRDTLKHGDADLVMGVPAADFERAAPTIAYYRSAYCFVTRKDRSLNITSLDDPALKRLKIGIQLVGGSATPPGLALARRGIIDNVTGYSIYTDYREPNPPARIVDAVVNGEVDVAIVWGPLAGYFAKHSSTPLSIAPLTPQLEPDGVPLAFDICVGVKRSKKELKEQVSHALQKHRAEVERILSDYGVPIVEAPARQSQAKSN
jgi:mxaJ protein